MNRTAAMTSPAEAVCGDFRTARRRSLLAVLAAVALALICLVPGQQAQAITPWEIEGYDSQTVESGTVYLLADPESNRFYNEVYLEPDALPAPAGRSVDTVLSVQTSNGAINAQMDYDGFYLYATKAVTATVSYTALLDSGATYQGAIQARGFTFDLGSASFTGMNYVLACGMTATPRVTNIAKVSWKSADGKVATVSSAGKITGKGLGATAVVASFNGISVPIPVDVTYKSAYQAVKNGFADYHTKLTYSQGKRTAKNYRDCSSFVSRCYWDNSLKRKLFAIGGSAGKSYPFTAADQAKWLYQNKKTVANGYVDPSKLLAGDTVYYLTGYAGVNKRWRSIDHAALYVGAGLQLGTGSWGEIPDDMPLNNAVKLQGYPSSNVKFIGRPLMGTADAKAKAAPKPSLSKKSVKLTKKKGKKHTVTLKMKNASGKVKWSSTNKKVASVNSKGKVTAKKKGKCTIKAKVGGKTYKCTVKVV